MTCWQAMKRLEDIGYSFHLDAGRAVGVLAGEAPPEASALLAVARSDREGAAEYVRQRRSGAVVMDDGCTYSVLDALAIGQAVKRGEAVLLSPVIYHREPVNVSIYWQPVQSTAEEVLQKHRQRLENALHMRLQEMEQETFEGWTDAEIDRFCEQYDRYKTLLEVL